MSKLRAPVGDALREGFDEVDVQRVWRGIQRRAAASHGAGRGRRWAVPGLALALALGVVLLLVLLPRLDWAARPLELAGGGAPTLVVAAADGPARQVVFSDGSRVVLAPGATLDVLSNDSASFQTALRRGRTSFDVQPGAHRRWLIECGLASVEVVGTAFSIDRQPGRVEVVVERGTVIVRGERVPDQVQRVSAGERLVVTSPPTNAAVVAPATGRAPAAAVSAPTAAPPAGVAGSARPSPSASVRDRIDDLVQRADAARAAGNVPLATDLLERAVEEAASDDPRRALAALTLARLNMGQEPDRASRALSTALTGAPPGLEEDVLARLVEARARAGDRDGARRAAARYERAFPNGARLAEVRRWVSE